MPKGQITSLNRANKNSESLRTTVPANIIKQFDLQEGDKLRWKLEAIKKNEIIVRLEPIKLNEKSTGKDGVGAL
ncbi:AbrB/MazE/SpoVT family DNA-binding domain-containing protein [Candidatus Pacearchaeota archaeon]|jgi:bifunctional DNA-binding transcriptional regulator/antitoxin component of YhaV-PrlF toxin-antitoxin module|nr:AbrB/MazE/SpoVT family DNA-binding domain-containing protein [Candidatus Pacearchaeota archaeon]